MNTPTSSAVEVNGFAIREIRKRTGIGIAALAHQVGMTSNYLTKIELGHNRRVSAEIFKALQGALAIQDQRALLAHPHAETQAGAA